MLLDTEVWSVVTNKGTHRVPPHHWKHPWHGDKRTMESGDSQERHPTKLIWNPDAVRVYSFVLAVLERGHQQSKTVTENKPVQHLCKDQLQGLPREQTLPHVPLSHTNWFYIQHGQHHCEPPASYSTAINTRSSRNGELEPSQSHFFTEEKASFPQIKCNLWFRSLHLRATDLSLHLYECSDGKLCWLNIQLLLSITTDLSPRGGGWEWI